ncbi:MAG: cardiolipin synthase [Corynebacterium sp.]|nr:cardiolipin synthase [Corynebacterium sp.]
MFDINLEWWQTFGLIIDYTIKIMAIGTVPEGRKPGSSNAWLLAILVLPLVGLPLFLLMGSPYINRRRHRVQQEANAMTGDIHSDLPDLPHGENVGSELTSMVKLNRRLTGMPALPGNVEGLHADYQASFQRMAEMIDQAEEYVHIEIYIVAWDCSTEVFFNAVERAVARGVKVRLLFDQVGSWKYPGYLKLGRRLTEIGVDWHLMLPLQPWRWRFRRPDLRNHRKLVIIDGRVGFMGSQNLIADTYLMRRNIKNNRRWVDIMVELTGPIVASLEMVFAVDWYQESGENLTIEKPRITKTSAENILQLVPSGPGYTTEPNLRIFNTVVHHAKERIILCSPYFIPDESLLEAITTACYRGVQVDLLVNEKSDQFMVGHAQSSYYQGLLEAGVNIYMYRSPDVLHSKFIVADPYGDAVAIMGSSNMDMRSFGLNYEVSLMTARGILIDQLTDLADVYINKSRKLTLAEWSERGFWRRYIDNAMRLTSALQ